MYSPLFTSLQRDRCDWRAQVLQYEYDHAQIAKILLLLPRLSARRRHGRICAAKRRCTFVFNRCGGGWLYLPETKKIGVGVYFIFSVRLSAPSPRATEYQRTAHFFLQRAKQIVRSRYRRRTGRAHRGAEIDGGTRRFQRKSFVKNRVVSGISLWRPLVGRLQVVDTASGGRFSVRSLFGALWYLLGLLYSED